MNILEKIQTMKEARDWSAYDLAEKAGISQTTLSSLFSRKSDPKIDTLKCLCDAFGITLSQFFLEDESIELLSASERQLLDSYRKLSQKQKEGLIALISEKRTPPTP